MRRRRRRPPLTARRFQLNDVPNAPRGPLRPMPRDVETFEQICLERDRKDLDAHRKLAEVHPALLALRQLNSLVEHLFARVSARLPIAVRQS
jgi:hypothetical protein